MRDVTETSRFRKDIRRQKKRGCALERFADVVELLAADGELPKKFKPHQLRGEWSDIWDCHIAPDWLLLYEVTDTEVILFRTGTHADLFE